MAPPTALSSPPASLKLDPFYRKYLDANGIPIISSEYTVDEALFNAKKTVLIMLGAIHDSIRLELVRHRIRVAIISQYEKLSQIPEWGYGIPNYRGVGATVQTRTCVTSEENLVCGRNMTIGDRHQGYEVLTHEFAHTIHLMGVPLRELDSALIHTFDMAMSKNLWKGTYSATNRFEYWAQAVQIWFSAARLHAPRNDSTIILGNREELKAYDPDLHDLIGQYFSTNVTKPGCY